MTKKKKAKDQRDESIEKFHLKDLNVNIGTFIFGAIFIYLIITVIIYISANHVETYQVTTGPLSKNECYTALILRNEEVVSTPQSGYANYYITDSARVKTGGSILSISDVSNIMENQANVDVDYDKLQNLASKFSNNFDNDDYQSLYDFKYSLNAELLSQSGGSSSVGTVLTASTPGYVCYSSDGYENLSETEVTNEIFSDMHFSMDKLQTEDRVSAGSPVYRLIKDESWSIIIPISDKETVKLASFKKIKVKFSKDGNTETGKITLMKNGDERFAKIDFSNGMFRYAEDRFVDIELVTNQISGLKIPISSVVAKDFFVIPIQYATNGGEDGDLGFIRRRVAEDGTVSEDFVEATIYEKYIPESEDETDPTHQNEGLYFVDTDEFQVGDVIIKPNSTLEYTVEAMDSLNGVYCVNKGYAVFRKIVILDQNEEYCIVDSGTKFGIAQYDYIVQDASTVKEQQIITAR